MQILGLSDSTPKPENRLKALLWPAIRHETDLDYVTRQGFWICFIVAILSLVVGAFQGGVIFSFECYEALFYFLSGVGVRMRSVFAAVSAFLIYSAGTIVVGLGLPRIIFMALLLANVRGTISSARWRSTQTEPPPIPLDETIMDKLVDRFPITVWPFGRFVYYAVAAIEAALTILSIIEILKRRSFGA